MTDTWYQWWWIHVQKMIRSICWHIENRVNITSMDKNQGICIVLLLIDWQAATLSAFDHSPFIHCIDDLWSVHTKWGPIRNSHIIAQCELIWCVEFYRPHIFPALICWIQHLFGECVRLIRISHSKRTVLLCVNVVIWCVRVFAYLKCHSKCLNFICHERWEGHKKI